MANALPPARGQRLAWSELPKRIQAAVEHELGGQVVEAISQPEGFSPALAARLKTATGIRAFIKAVPPGPNPDSPQIYRREIEVVTKLPARLSVPRLLWWLDEGPEGWVALMFEHLDAQHPELPWRVDQLKLVMDLLTDLAETSAPASLRHQSAGDWIAAHWSAWAQLAAAPPPGLDAWSLRHVDRLANVERRVREAADGNVLVHLDVRWDNLLVDTHKAWLVDWPWARRGTPWLDAVLFAPTVEIQGGPSAEEVLAMHPPAMKVELELVISVVAATAGMLTKRSFAPPPPGLPTLRAFQAALARAFRLWLQRLTKWS